ncbi:MAG: division/cell wall cluster transcriptional repressor MraZ [Actinomycetota bacterium]
MSFTGEFRRTIDSKGRLIVPPQMREELEEDEAVLVIAPDNCIEMHSGPGWRAYEQSLVEQRRSKPQIRAVIRRISASAHADQVDRQGRLHVPQNLRDYAGIEREVVIIGHLDRAEIWSPERFEQAAVPQDEMAGFFAELEL